MAGRARTKKTKKEKKQVRRVRLTAPLIDAVCDLIAMGNTYYEVEQILGLRKNIISFWTAKGREAGEGLHYELIFELERAKERAQDALMGVIRQNAMEGGSITEETKKFNENGLLIETIEKTKKYNKDWRAAAKLLELRHPEKYRRTYEENKVDLTSVSKQSKPFEIRIVDPAERDNDDVAPADIEGISTVEPRSDT